MDRGDWGCFQLFERLPYQRELFTGRFNNPFFQLIAQTGLSARQQLFR